MVKFVTISVDLKRYQLSGFKLGIFSADFRNTALKTFVGAARHLGWLLDWQLFFDFLSEKITVTPFRSVRLVTKNI